MGVVKLVIKKGIIPGHLVLNLRTRQVLRAKVSRASPNCVSWGEYTVISSVLWRPNICPGTKRGRE